MLSDIVVSVDDRRIQRLQQMRFALSHTRLKTMHYNGILKKIGVMRYKDARTDFAGVLAEER